MSTNRLSVSHTIKDVEHGTAVNFVENYLSGRLLPAGQASSDNLLSYHMPKSHGEHKCRSGRFERTHTGGSVSYYTTTRTMILRTANADRKTAFNIKQLWDDFCADTTPLWQLVSSNPSAYDCFKKDSGKYCGQTFKSVYKKADYVDWLLDTDNAHKVKNSLGMRLLFEYCNARRAAPPGQAAARPKAVAKTHPQARDQKRKPAAKALASPPKRRVKDVYFDDSFSDLLHMRHT